jgi:hypothetical protein
VTGRETAGLSAKGQPIDADAGLPQLVQGGRTRGARGDARSSRQAEVLGGAAAARQREERLFARGRFRMAR